MLLAMGLGTHEWGLLFDYFLYSIPTLSGRRHLLESSTVSRGAGDRFPDEPLGLASVLASGPSSGSCLVLPWCVGLQSFSASLSPGQFIHVFAAWAPGTSLVGSVLATTLSNH